MFGVPVREAMQKISRTEFLMWERYFAWKDTSLQRDQYLTASIVRELRFLAKLKTAAPGASVFKEPLENCILHLREKEDEEPSLPSQVTSVLELSQEERVARHKAIWKAAFVVPYQRAKEAQSKQQEQARMRQEKRKRPPPPPIRHLKRGTQDTPGK